MKISDLFEQSVPDKVTRKTNTEVVFTNPQSGIERKVPIDPNKEGSVTRDKDGKLVFDPETPGDVADDIEPGEEIRIEPGSAKGPQGTQGTQGSM